jgi:hypothetical protein
VGVFPLTLKLTRLLFRYSNARGVIVPGNSDNTSSQMTEAFDS